MTLADGKSSRGGPASTVDRAVPGWLRRGRTQFHNQHAGPAEVAKAGGAKEARKCEQRSARSYWRRPGCHVPG
jgi:hypothetical protein